MYPDFKVVPLINIAVRLYEKLGFVIRQELNAYYRDGESAYLMAIELD